MSNEPPPPDAPLFVVGANGSGSTLLRLMLDSHERIAIPSETGFLRLVTAHRWVPYWELGDQWYGHLGLSEPQMLAAVGGFYAGLFRDHAAAQGKARWGDKTPFHLWHVATAVELFPAATVIAIVRHPRAVMRSVGRRFDRDGDKAERYWSKTTMALLHSVMDLGDRAVLLRYEDLVTTPEAVMRPLLDHVGEPWSDSVLHHDAVQADRGTSLVAEGFTRVDRPVDTAAMDQWEREVPETRREPLRKRTVAMARFLGYDPDRAQPLRPLTTPAGVPLLTGSELRARRTSSDARVDWSWRPAAGPENQPLRPPYPTRTAAAAGDVGLGDLVRDRLRRWRPARRPR